MLERMIRICEENDIDITCCDFFIANEDGKIGNRAKRGAKLEILTQKEAIYELMLYRVIDS